MTFFSSPPGPPRKLYGPSRCLGRYLFESPWKLRGSLPSDLEVAISPMSFLMKLEGRSWLLWGISWFFSLKKVLEVKINLYAEFQPLRWLGSGRLIQGSQEDVPDSLEECNHYFLLRISSWSHNQSVCRLSAFQLTWKWPVSSKSSKEAKRTFLTP